MFPMAASLRKLPFEQQNGERPDWVGTRTTSLQVRRRKAAVGVSLPGSSPWSLSADDPLRTSASWETGRSGTVELTGAARLYRAASSDRRERG